MARNRREFEREVVQAAREMVGTLWPEVDQRGGCLYLTYAVIRVLAEAGIHAVMLAGSMSWPFKPLEEDDGVGPLHMSYVWEPSSPATLQNIIDGLFPEMHVWAGIPERSEYVDLVVRDLPAQCVLLTEQPWTGKHPPDYLWTHTSNLPPGVIYTPSASAARVAYSYLRMALGLPEEPFDPERKA